MCDLDQSLPLTLLLYLQNNLKLSPMMMLTHGLWIIICCKHHGEIICFVSKQAAASCILYLLLLLLLVYLCVKALGSVHSGYLGHQKEGGGGILHDLRGSVLRCVTNSPRNSVLLFPPSSAPLSVSRDSCHLQVFVICQLSLLCLSAVCCSFVRSAEYVLLCGLH